MNKLKENRSIFSNIAYFFIIAMFFVADRVFKNLALKQGLFISKPLMGEILKFKLFFNKNIAFSIPLSGIWLNILISAIVISLLLIIIYSKHYNSLNKISIFCLTLILFGAISNLLDRFFYGAVVDYFDLQYFTIFNLADFMISIGVIGLFINNIKKQENSEKINKEGKH